MELRFNAPNIITFIRVLLIPLFVVMLLSSIPYKNQFSAFIFIMLSISDMFDGYLARKKKQVTDFGKLIDPIADKLLISTALIFLTLQGKVPFWITSVIISREVILTAVRIYLLPFKIIIPAEMLGKIKTIVQSIAIVFLLLELPASYYILIAALVLTVASGMEYLYSIKKKTGIKVVNLPNLITMTRLLLVIPYAYFFVRGKTSLVLVLLAVITLSDKLDGISARMMNQKTELGSNLDSFTDAIFLCINSALFLQAGLLKPIFVLLFGIAIIVMLIMKVLYFSRLKLSLTSAISKLTVGFGYITIATFLIRFEFRHYFALASIALLYVSMFVFIGKTLAAFRKRN